MSQRMTMMSYDNSDAMLVIAGVDVLLLCL